MTKYSPHRILVVEDEPAIAQAVAARLRSEGHRVEVCGDGLTAVDRAEDFLPDLLVLDVMLPGIDGLEVCRRVQARRPVPVLMLTARDDESDVLIGLGVGADDYLTKPFSMRELSARVTALLRRIARYGAAAESALRLGSVTVDRLARRVRRDGDLVHLTATEFDLLMHLAERPGAVVSRERLLEGIWGFNGGGAVETRTVDTHVKALRRKLGAELIRTVHGIGYALAVES